MTAHLLGTVWFVCVLTAAGLIPTSAQEEVKYVKLGGPLEMLPNIILQNIILPITGIMWKHGPNKAAEWDVADGPDVDYYGSYKGRTLLTKETFKLVVQNMAISDGGIYSLEINGRMQGHSFKTEFIVDVPKPEVALKPLTCTPDSSQCLLVCQGNITGAGPVTYRWKKVNGEVKWMVSDSAQLTILNDEEGKTIKTFSCEMKNPVGEMLSEPYKNLFYVDPTLPTPVVAVAVVFGVVGCLLLPLVGWLIGVKTSTPFRNRISPTVRDRFPGPLKSWFFPDDNKSRSTLPKTPVDGGEGIQVPLIGVPTSTVTAGATTVDVVSAEVAATPGEGNGGVPTSTVTAGATTIDVVSAEVAATPGERNGGVPTSTVTAGATTIDVVSAEVAATPGEGNGGGHS